MTQDESVQEPQSLVKRALVEIRRMRERVDELEQAGRAPIAVVGIGCRFADGVSGPDAFWDLLREGREAIGEVPADRWDVDALYDPDPATPGKICTRRGGFLRDIDKFDAAFFGITPREAASMDPQQRLLLEVTWEALEHAAIPPHTLMESLTGVFVGVSGTDYLHEHLRATTLESIDAYLASGGTLSVAAGRLSYFLGLRGPSLSVDTACSSSLSAVHLACQSLRTGECSTALAAGVSVILSPEITVNFSHARMLSPDGRCKTFDAAADGYVRGEGCAVVVLKRLSDAVAHGDRVLAIVRGSAINQDGRSSGLTVPNGPAQEAVIRAALRNAQLTPDAVGYIEAHGTGTSLGDPIEVQALGSVFADRSPDHPVVIGSVKTNLGHLEAAAGIAGLIKVVLALQHDEIPRHLHFQSPNPFVPWERLPLRVAREAVAWPASTVRRVAGISSFGFSGTNVHVVVEEAPAAPPAETFADELSILPLSAKSDESLTALAERFESYLTTTDAAFEDVCQTASIGRTHLTHRLAIVAASCEDARAQLAQYRVGPAAAGVAKGETFSGAPEVAFLFAGQGSQ